MEKSAELTQMVSWPSRKPRLSVWADNNNDNNKRNI